MRRLLLAAALLPAFCPPLAAAPAETSAPERLHVRVSWMAPPLEVAGLSGESLVRDVSTHLSAAGLLVLSALDVPLDGPHLSAILDAVHLPTGALAYQISLELREDVLLARDPSLATTATTWSASTLGVCEPGDLPDDARVALLELADRFLEEVVLP